MTWFEHFVTLTFIVGTLGMICFAAYININRKK